PTPSTRSSPVACLEQMRWDGQEDEMARTGNAQNPPCRRCGAVETVSKGRENGRPRWRCRACGRSFGRTLGIPLYRLKTDIAEIVRALQVVLHRGSLRAAEEQTGHN